MKGVGTVMGSLEVSKIVDFCDFRESSMIVFVIHFLAVRMETDIKYCAVPGKKICVFKIARK